MSLVYNVARVLERNAWRHGDRLAVSTQDESLTHADLAALVRRLVSGLREVGLERGDVVALLLDNGVDFLASTFAVNGVGAVFLPLNLRLAYDEWRYIVAHSGARFLIAEERFADDSRRLSGDCPDLEQVIVTGTVADGPPSLRDVVDRGTGTDVSFVDTSADDVSRLMYTSGTTSRPKGVPLTYGNVLWKTFDHVVEFGMTSGDRTLVSGPMYHVGAYDLPGVSALYVGGSVVILPRFDAVAVLEAIQKHSVTNLWLAPAMVNAILALPEPQAYDTATVRFVTNGGEKMPTPLIKRFFEIFPNAWLADSYGLTETVSGDTFLDPEHVFSKLGSVGRPLLHVDLRVVDDDGDDVPRGTSGEVLLRGPKVFSGYWKDPEATARAFTDDWFHTGDVAHLDEDGYLFIDDRKNDLIISGGENIASPEVERVLYQHPAVHEAAVVGVPDEKWGEVPKAVVVLRPGATATAAELVEFCREHLARFKVPKHVEFVGSLPRTATGKVLKRELR
ncbi:acyl-CoA synthetase [Actinophytocola sp.]|uniref:acyl-CoA synthetase n=1 Tax=Actinophytocola sp. TaxID=1872138 RepID=UPI003D6B491B